MKLNVDLLRKVQAAILEEPKRVNMDLWAFPIEWQVESGQNPPCNTVGCVAGWSIALEKNLRGNDLATEFSIEHQAIKLLLGVTEPASAHYGIMGKLFYISSWPTEFRARMQRWNGSHVVDPGTPEYAQIVSDRIDGFIDSFVEMTEVLS